MRYLPTLLLVLVLAGCGGSDSGGDGGGSSSSTTDGKQLFADACGSCHTLEAAGTDGTFGPNLDELGPDRARVLKAIADGPGSMPGGLYEGAQAEAVADFVSSGG